MDLDEIMRLLASFERERLEYVVVGGVALNFHGLIRSTEDLDFFIRPTTENVERLRKALKNVYDDPDIEQISAEDLAGDYPAIRYYPPSSELFLDILARLGEFAGYDDLEVQEIEASGIKVRVATPRTLYWLKKGSVRDIDRFDAQALREKFHLEE